LPRNLNIFFGEDCSGIRSSIALLIASLVAKCLYVFLWIVKAVCVVWSWVPIWLHAWDNGRCLGGRLFQGQAIPSGPIKHIFVLMLENRAFDHMLGFSGIEARTR